MTYDGMPREKLLRQQLEALLQTIEENQESLKRLPAFIRPMVLKHVQASTGLSLEDWQKQIQQLLETGSCQANLVLLLPRLKTYIDNAPSEVAKYTRDPEILKEVTETTLRQSSVVEELIATLNRIINK